MDRSRVNQPGRGWDAMAIVSLLYVPMAALAMGPYFLEDPTVLVSQFPEGRGFREFVESALAGRTGPYQAHLVGMVSHTLTGAVLMCLGPYLLYSRPRRRMRSHVIAGRLYVATALASMTGSFVFLVNEPLEEAFTGPVFALGLWSMLFGTVTTALLGWFAAVRHQIRLHILWVCLNYGFLVSAPMLRFEWGLFGALGVGDRLEDVSPQAAIHVVTLTTSIALVGGLQLADHVRPRAPLLGVGQCQSSPRGALERAARPLALALIGAGVAAFAMMAGRYVDHGTTATTHLAWFAVPVAVVIGAVVMLRRRALARGRSELAQDHLVLLGWLTASPVVALVISTIARHWIGLAPAVADATGVTLCGGWAVWGAAASLHIRTRRADLARSVPEAPRSRSRETSPAS